MVIRLRVLRPLRACRPGVERCEARDLPSGVIASLGHGPAIHAMALPSTGPIGLISADPAPPTPREAARRVFRGGYVGSYTVGGPLLADQSGSLRVFGPGSNNRFLHGTLDLRVFTPAVPGDPITGAASLVDRNTNSGAILLLNLRGASSQVDAHGRPTHLDFEVNGGGGSGGIFASSVGGGTIDIRYVGHRADVILRGRITTTGVGSPLLDFTSTRV